MTLYTNLYKYRVQSTKEMASHRCFSIQQVGICVDFGVQEIRESQCGLFMSIERVVKWENTTVMFLCNLQKTVKSIFFNNIKFSESFSFLRVYYVTTGPMSDKGLLVVGLTLLFFKQFEI